MVSFKHLPLKIWAILLLFSFTVFKADAQTLDIGFEFQAYPTGLIPGLRIEKGFAEKNAVHLRLGYNLIDHRDLGPHQDETGNGYGFTIGYKRYLKADFKGWSLGIRNDIWFNTIDWKENIDTPQETAGITKITVVQPTAELSYLFEFGNSWIITPSIGFGYEVNVKTEGEPTGEGAILLLGFTIGKRL
jgi:hypothetical protein